MGWLAGAVHWVVATNWVIEVMHHYGGLAWLGAVGALVGMGLILGATWALIAGITALVPAVWRPWIFPFAWVAVDALRRFQPFQFPWNDVAAVVAHQPAMLASLPVWGASGLGWALLSCGAGFWGAARADRRPAAVALLIATVGCTISFSALAPDFEPSGAPVRVAVLQPGTTLEEKWDPGEWQEVTNRVWTLTSGRVAGGHESGLDPDPPGGRRRRRSRALA